MNTLYICNFDGCKQIFIESYPLKKHFRIHTGEKPFECLICNMTFSQKSDKKRHIFNVHQKWISNIKLKKNNLKTLTVKPANNHLHCKYE